MTTLVLTSHRPHRPAGGAPLRNWQNIRALGTLGPVDIVTVGVDDAPEPVAGVREWVPFDWGRRSRGDRIRTALAPLRRGVHPGVDVYRVQAVTDWLRARARTQRYDLAVIEGVALAPYLDDLRRLAGRIVFDAHNVESVLHFEQAHAMNAVLSRWQRAKNTVLQTRMLAEERRVARGADLLWVCSSDDAKQFGELYGRTAGITVVPNGVDVEAYRRPGVASPDDDWTAHPVTMVYAGQFAYTPNEEAALRLIREVLPLVRRAAPNARVVLVGRDPSPALVDAARGVAGVDVTGQVESVLPYLEQPCIVTLPIQVGGGTRLKILEAFAVGRPVVSTARGAHGIDGVDGDHLLIREDAAAIAAGVLQLWREPDLRARICERALALVRADYSWTAAVERIRHSLAAAPAPGDGRRPMLKQEAH